MNAPTSAAALAKPTLQMIALGALVPSSTHIQEMRRARFDDNLLKELAISIKAVGVLQPILVRLSQASGRADRFEIVAGERRFLGAKKAGLPEIPATVRELSDEQVLEVQLIENLQREGLHELEEAEGYEELMKLKKVDADAVADMVGRSKSYVYKRAKLLALCPEARKAFYAGEMDASTALLIARIPGAEFQKRAMKELEEQRRYGDVSNFKEASEFIRDNFMLRLKEAPFDRGDAALVPAAGSCQACPKRTGNQSDLFGDVKDGDLCTDAKCFDSKRQAHFSIARLKIEASGKKVIHGDAAKKILPQWEEGGDYIPSGYKKLTESHWTGANNRKVADIVGKEYDPVLIQHPGTGKIIQVATVQALGKASGQKEPKERSSGAYNYEAAQQRSRNAGPDVDQMLTDRLAELIHKNAPKTFGKQWILDLAGEIYEKLSLRDEAAVASAWGWPENAFDKGKLPAQASKLGERDLVLLMFHLVFAVGPYTRDGVLKLFNIKEQATRELIIKERKDAKVKARAEAKAAKDAKAAKKVKAAKK